MSALRNFGGERSEAISLLEIWHIVRADWVVLAASIAVFSAAAIVLAFVMTPVYRAEVVVAPVKSGGPEASASALLSQFGSLAGMAGINLGGFSSASSKGSVTIQSRTLIEEFIRQNKLIPILYANRESPNPGSPPTLWHAVEAFKHWVNTEVDPETGLITVRVEWTDPKLAADWANGLVDLANEMLRDRDLADAQRNIKYLDEQLSKTNVVGLQQVLYDLIEVEMRTLMLANARQEYALATIDRAVVPELRQRPKRKQIAVLGAVLGTMIGLAAIALRHSLRAARAVESG